LRCAVAGVVHLWRTQRSFRIQMVALLIVVAAGWAFGISLAEWLAIVLCCGFVLFAEAANTAIELLADALHPDEHPGIGRAKDVAAGAVLLAAGTSVVVGVLVFLHPVMWWLSEL
jgi:diacylglycerol kinase